MGKPRSDIHQVQTQIGQQLAAWSGFSLGASAVMALMGNALWRGVASQFAGWGAIDLIIAILGLKSAQKRAADPESHMPEQQAKARDDLRKVLWINTALDVGYVSGGVALARTKGHDDRFWRGAGWGIVIQGGFLFVFDLMHALLLRD